MLVSSDIKSIAREVGFDSCGVARADALTDEEYPLREWLSRGWHGGLQYMERNVDMRLDPRLLLPGAQSIICCVSAYPPPDTGLRPVQPSTKIAAYAMHREYHKVIKDMLHSLKQRLGIEGKVCCDTVPISDKHWAARAGLGWIGRHTLLITPQWGTWINLGEIVTTEVCDNYDPLPSPSSTPCTHCSKCVEACPNGALAAEGRPMLNVTQCTAYYNTHNPRPMPAGIDAHGYTLGCDICQLACPFNHKHTSSLNP